MYRPRGVLVASARDLSSRKLNVPFLFVIQTRVVGHTRGGLIRDVWATSREMSYYEVGQEAGVHCPVSTNYIAVQYDCGGSVTRGLEDTSYLVRRSLCCKYGVVTV